MKKLYIYGLAIVVIAVIGVMFYSYKTTQRQHDIALYNKVLSFYTAADKATDDVLMLKVHVNDSKLAKQKYELNKQLLTVIYSKYNDLTKDMPSYLFDGEWCKTVNVAKCTMMKQQFEIK